MNEHTLRKENARQSMGDLSYMMGGAEKRIAFIMGQPMQPCPKCKSFNLRFRTPIKTDAPANATAKQLLGVWARATKAGAMMEGPVYIICLDCRHKGPSVDCSGRSREDVGNDPVVSKEAKRLWNEQ